jgi:hypothetical protein
MVCRRSAAEFLDFIPPLKFLFRWLHAELGRKVPDRSSVITIEQELCGEVNDVTTVAGSEIMPSVSGNIER